jgi:hypothetical protein
MEHFKTITIPAKAEETKQVIDFVSCDICKKKIEKDIFSAEEIKIIHKTGSHYPEGGCGEDKSFDICGDCFENTLSPFIESYGSAAKIEIWDW